MSRVRACVASTGFAGGGAVVDGSASRGAVHRCDGGDGRARVWDSRGECAGRVVAGHGSGSGGVGAGGGAAEVVCGAVRAASGELRGFAGGRGAGGLGRCVVGSRGEFVAVGPAGAWVQFSERRSVGHADGPRPARDGGGFGESVVGGGVGGVVCGVGRGTAGAGDCAGCGAGAAVDADVAVGGAGESGVRRAARAPASGHASVSGVADGGERRAGLVAARAGGCVAGAAVRRQAGGDHLSLRRGARGEGFRPGKGAGLRVSRGCGCAGAAATAEAGGSLGDLGGGEGGGGGGAAESAEPQCAAPGVGEAVR